MTVRDDQFHVLTVGWDPRLIDELWDAVATKGPDRFSHIMHPNYVLEDWRGSLLRPDTYFLREELRQPMPDADERFLASLEGPGVPSIHNMIMGDRIVSKVSYDLALRYLTFVARRLQALFDQTAPSVVLGGFDAVHGALALAVARHMNIPWFALSFSVIPTGLACFCDRLTPAARVQLAAAPPHDLSALAEESLRKFERRTIRASAYIAPRPLSLAGRILKLPAQLSGLSSRFSRARLRDFLQFTEVRESYNVRDALAEVYRASRARKAISKVATHVMPPAYPYVLFGLHMQPESSIDVWAPFFSNQMWVIELLSRSIPPSHKLLVKIHKSDIAKYSREQLGQMQVFPGVELVRPFADTRSFIEKADLVAGIQGTMGLEAALLGKPVVMLGDSPVASFPSASSIGEITDLPRLIRQKLAESRPSREKIVEAYAAYLAPFFPAGSNDWSHKRGEEEIGNYIKLFGALKQYLANYGASGGVAGGLR